MNLRYIIIALFLCNFSFAQNWNLGVKGGLNIASANFKNSTAELSSTVGFHAGGYGNTQLTDQISLQPEVLFSLQGWKSKTNDVTRTLSYLTVPIAVKYALVEKFNVHTGPQLGFLIDTEDELESLITSTDLSILIGAEYQITDQIGATIRYNHGLSNIFDNPESAVKIRSRILQLSCSYRLTR